jgi:hypothetical protein
MVKLTKGGESVDARQKRPAAGFEWIGQREGEIP